MRAFEVTPRFSRDDVGELNEVFHHQTYLTASESDQQAMMLASSVSKYRSELAYPWDNYFGLDLRPMLRGTNVLDLGCFTGGRAIAWYQRYDLGSITGIDVNPVFIEAGRRFAESQGANARFVQAFGEALPFGDGTFDAILSFDVFEHVQDLSETLRECRRVLRPGGRLLLVFPSYFHPTEHHLSLVTRAPCIHWLFSGTTLLAAYNGILEERGAQAGWYCREHPELEPWERGNTVNGTTVRRFKSLLDDSEWRVLRECYKPLGAVGRNASGSALAKTVSVFLYPAVSVPALRDFFAHRMTFILERR